MLIKVRRGGPVPIQILTNKVPVGKKQLNQLMTFLDNKGGSIKEGVAGGRGDMAVRTVRAKREADEAGPFCFRRYPLLSADRASFQIKSTGRVCTG